MMMMKRKCFEFLFSFESCCLYFIGVIFYSCWLVLFSCLFVCFFLIFLLHCFFLIALVCGDGGSVCLVVMLLCLLYISICAV